MKYLRKYDWQNWPQAEIGRSCGARKVDFTQWGIVLNDPQPQIRLTVLVILLNHLFATGIRRLYSAIDCRDQLGVLANDKSAS